MDEVKKDNKEFLKILFWVFLIGSIFGAYFEEIRHILWYFRHHGMFNYSPRRGLIWGPLSPVYGIGAVSLAVVLGKKNDSLIITFLKASLLGGIVEYSLSLLQELATGTVSWNYSYKALNIGGRTTVPYMLAWGIIGILFVKVIYPYLIKMIKMMPKKIYDRVTVILLVFVAVDVIVSWSAYARKIYREHDVAPVTAVGKMYDEYFDDEFFGKKFPNMRKVKK